MLVFRGASRRFPLHVRWVRLASAAALGCMALVGCTAEPDTTSSAASASSVPASPAASDPPARTGTPTNLPQPVERPCLFKGKDLNDYKSIVQSFDKYFNGLSANVLSKQYKAEAADLAPLDQTADRLIARLWAGDVKQVSSGINVVEDMDSIIGQVNAIIEAALKAEPDLSPDMSQAELNSSLERQRSRLQRVAVICIQRIAAG